MTASIATDLPEPDSPTIASTSPSSSVSDTLSTARKLPCAVAKSTERSAISRRGIEPALLVPRCRLVLLLRAAAAQAFAEGVDLVREVGDDR